MNLNLNVVLEKMDLLKKNEGDKKTPKEYLNWKLYFRKDRIKKP